MAVCVCVCRSCVQDLPYDVCTSFLSSFPPSQESAPLKGGRGSANLVLKCHLCSRENSISKEMFLLTFFSNTSLTPSWYFLHLFDTLITLRCFEILADTPNTSMLYLTTCLHRWHWLYNILLTFWHFCLTSCWYSADTLTLHLSVYLHGCHWLFSWYLAGISFDSLLAYNWHLVVIFDIFLIYSWLF